MKKQLHLIKTSKLLWYMICLLPMVIMGGLIARYGVDVPYWDEWDSPGMALVAAGKGELDFGDLFLQHNESRLVVPRLFFLGFSSIWGWHVKPVMFLTLGLASLISLGLLRLSRNSLSLSSASYLVLLSITNWLLFSTAQWENWLMGLQIITFVPIACIIAGLLILSSQLPPLVKFLTCGLLATLSTFTFANGMLVWVVLLPTIVSFAWVDHRLKRWMPIGWLVWTVSVLLIYFFDYHKPAHHPSFWEALNHPFKSMVYFCAYLGAPLGFDNLYAATLLGLSLFIIFVGAGVHIFYKSSVQKDLDLLQRSLPWLSIGSYAVLSALLSTLGRVGFGIPQALSSRYITFSSFLPIALTYLLALLLTAAPTARIWPRRFQWAGLSLAGLYFIGFSLTYVNNWPRLIESYQSRTFGKSCLILINLAEDIDCVEAHHALFPVSALVKERSNLLQKQGILRPRLADKSIFRNFRISEPEGAHGYFDHFAPDGAGNFLVGGWAILSERQHPASAVLLTYTTIARETRLLKVLKVGDLRADVANAVGRPYLKSGWGGQISSASIPPDAKALQAWAFDVDNRVAFSLSNDFPLPR